MLKHTQKIKLAKKMAKRGATGIFNSKGWWNRKLAIAKKELARMK